MKLSMLLILITTAPILTACTPPEGPRQRPAPRLELHELFPPTDSADRSASSTSSSEDRLRQLAANAPEHASDTTARIRIPLGSSLSAELPHTPDWTWSQRPNLTLISHQPDARSANILILAQPFSPTRQRRPAQATRAFVHELIPSPSPLATLARSPDLSAQLPQLSTQLNALQTSLTGGRGLGFTPAPDTFSGWRLIGENTSETLLRLASYTGTWHPQPELPAGLTPQSISTLSSLLSTIPPDILPPPLRSEALDNLNALSSPPRTNPNSAPPSRRLPEPARLIIATVEASPSQGIHMAILCTGIETCSQAAHLTHLLQSISPAEASTSAPSLSTHAHTRLINIDLP